MKALFNGLSAIATPVGYIIHVGAGQCSELQRYLELDPQQIVLIEADAQQAMQLKSMTQLQKNINVLTCAVADKKEAKTLKILSNPRDSSLLMPEKILDHYPSLVIASEQAVTTETLNDALKGYTLDKDYQHLLILEVQGLEGLIIKSVPVECLQQFSGIIIRSSAEQLYQQEQQENIVNLLKPAGFECSYQENEQYSNAFTKFYFQRNDEKIALKRCVQQKNELTTENAEQTKQAAERLQQAKKFKQERDTNVKVVAEKQSQIEQLNTEKAELAKLATERLQQIKKFKQERDTKDIAVKENQSLIEQLNTDKVELSKLATERLQQIKKLKQERDAKVIAVKEKQSQIEQLLVAKAKSARLTIELQLQVEIVAEECDLQAKQSIKYKDQLDIKLENIEQLTQQRSESDRQLKEFRGKENQRQQELDEAKQTASLSVKLQMMKENDLRDLQQRYKTSLATQESQHELLNKLGERLSLAADYYHRISLDTLVKSEKKFKLSFWNPFKK